MNKLNITEGDWFVESEYNPPHVRSSSGIVVAEVDSCADAYLIAQSKNMYEMLNFISENPSETNVIPIRRLLNACKPERSN